MKKIFIVLLMILSLSFLSCKSEEKTKANIYLPDGTPALALANVLADEIENTTFNIVPASEIAARVATNDCDMAIMPTTASVQLYKKGIKLKLASVNVFGNLYVVGTKKIDNLKELVGKKVFTTGSTTLQMLDYVFKNNNIAYEESQEVILEKVAVCLASDATEIIPKLKMAMNNNEELYAVLGEPQVTKATTIISDLEISFDLQKEYKKITGYDGYPQACLVVKEDFYNNNSKYVNNFLNKLASNTTYLENNVDNLSSLFKKYESNLANMTFTLDTIKRCNVRLELSKDVKSSVMGYIKSLLNIDLDDNYFLL